MLKAGTNIVAFIYTNSRTNWANMALFGILAVPKIFENSRVAAATDAPFMANVIKRKNKIPKFSRVNLF